MGARTRGLANNVLTSGKLDATDAISGVIPASNIANGSLTSATTYGSVTGGVPAVSSDPPSPSDGDIWYNTTTGKIRFRSVLQAWASGGNLTTTRLGQSGAGKTDNTASLVFGGGTFGPQAGVTPTESYNGSSWTEVNDLNTGRYYAGRAGTTTSALMISGRNPALGTPTQKTGAVESWNGSSWTEITDVNTLRSNMGGDGASNTSAIIAAGNDGTSPVAITETWNGSSWTEVGDLNTARAGTETTGIITSALVMGGEVPTPAQVGNTESWNGSAWTEVADLNNARQAMMGCGASNTASLVYGGYGPPKAQTEIWNGSAWTETGDMTTDRNDFGASGATTSAIAAGGAPPPTGIATTEEWTNAVTTFDVG